MMAALLITGSAFSQILIGPKGGLNVSFLQYSYADSDVQPDNPGPNLGLHLGVQAQYAVMDNIFVQPGILFSMKGGTFKETEKNYADETVEDKTSLRINYLEIPINVAYGFEQFQVFAGPYFAFGVGGSNKITRTKGNTTTEVDGDVEFGKQPISTEDTRYLKGLDVGINIGAGYRLDMMYFQLGYAAGLANIYPELEQEYVGFDRDDFVTKNGVIMASFTYWLDVDDF
jgi:hypothetical protein